MRGFMKYAWLGCLLVGSTLFAGTQDSEFNVNTRYTVETVVIAADGWKTDLAADHDQDGKLTPGLRKTAFALIGEKLNPPVLAEIGRRLRKEFRARTVEHHVLRGKTPDYVQVVFEIRLKPTRFDVSVPKFLYGSARGLSGAIEGTATVGRQGFTAGLVSDADEMPERYSGIVARYDNPHLVGDYVRLRFAFEDYHEQWNSATVEQASHPGIASAAVSGLYRARRNFEPEITFLPLKGFEFSVGTSMQTMQDEALATPAASANALVGSMRYHKRLEGDESQNDLDAAYSLRAASRVLGSDLVYARHRWEFRFMRTSGKSVVIDDVTAGCISGRAPLFERFALGNSKTLRGWNMYGLDPLGGSRMIHNSAEYRYGNFQIFYDSGAVWDSGETPALRHSAGVGLRQGVFSLAVAFPLREGRIDPIFMVGMNY